MDKDGGGTLITIDPSREKITSMAGRYTKPAQKSLDGVLCLMEKDFGFTKELQPYYTKRVRQ